MDNGDYITGSSSFHLNDIELERHKAQAEEGNGESAFVLYKHYAFSDLDEEKSIYWLKKGVELGNEDAIHHYENINFRSGKD